jgi:hypothetical protein
MIYASPAVILSPAAAASLKMPVFLWRNRVTAIEADDEDSDYPASNLANGQTISQWRSTSTDPQYLTFSLSPAEPINAFGIERHNLGSAQIAVTVEGLTGDDGADWQVLGEFAPGNDGTVMGMIEPAYYVGLRFLLEPQETPPQIAVVYVGDALIMPRSLPEGFVLPGDARERETVGGVSESGDFLGEVITSERTAFSVPFELLEGDWYRAHMREFTRTALPFFYAFSPATMPAECGYVKFSGSPPKGQVSRFTGHVDVSLDLVGVV